MAVIKGTNVGSPVVPFDTLDQNPSHEARYGKGGYRTVATTAERDAIPAARLEAGMLVYVTDDDTIYQLGSDLESWSEFSGAQGPPEAHAASHQAGGSDELFNQALNTDSSVTFEVVSLNNGTQITEGTFDNDTGGEGGISLHCLVGYELNWQGGRLRSTADGGETAATIWCDSPILWQGEESGVSIDATGIAFPDASLQTTAWTGTVDIGDVSNLQTTLDGKQKTITSGTASPTGGNDGDIYLQYTA